MCTPPFAISIDNDKATFRFPIINRKLNSQIDDFIRILCQKSEIPFSHLQMEWEKGQSTKNQIGQILSALKDKQGLESIAITIHDNNKLQQLFSKNLHHLIKFNQKSLHSLQLKVGKNCFQCDIFSPLMVELEGCKNMKNITIHIDDKNGLSSHPMRFQVKSAIQTFQLFLTMQNNGYLFTLSQSLNESMLNLLTTIHLSIQIRQVTTPLIPIDMSFLKQCQKLKSLSLKTNSQIFSIDSCPQSVEKLSIKQAIHHHPERALQMLEKFKALRNLNEIDMEFLRNSADIQIMKELNQIICNNNLDRIALTFEYQLFDLATIQQLLQIDGKQVELHIKIQKQCPYEEVYKIIQFVKNKRVIVDTPSLCLDIIAKDTVLIEATENQDAIIRQYQQFPQIDVLKELSQKIDQKYIVKFSPRMDSNYNKYRFEFYMKLLSIKSQQMKLEISGEFELGFGSLVVNIDDATGKMLTMVMNEVIESPINKIVLYHHTTTQVRQYYKYLVENFNKKFFLEFVNYVMYTQSMTPYYKKMLMPCQNQAGVYKRLVWQLMVIHRRFAMRLCQWELRNIQKAAIKQFLDE